MMTVARSMTWFLFAILSFTGALELATCMIGHDQTEAALASVLLAVSLLVLRFGIL